MAGKGNPDLIAKNGPGRGRTKGSKNRISRERWEQEVKYIALYDPRKMFVQRKGTRSWSLLDIHEMPEEMRRCIASVKVRTENLTAGDGAQDETVEVRLLDKMKGLELGARANGWLKDKVEVTLPEEQLSRLDRAKIRARKDGSE